MRIKRIISGLVFIALLCAGIIFAKDAALKLYLQRYLRTRLGEQCSVEAVQLSYDRLLLRGVHVGHEHFRFDLKELTIAFSFPEGIKPHIDHITVSGLDAKIHSIAKTQELLKNLFGEPHAVVSTEEAASEDPPVYSLTLNAVTLSMKEGDFYLNTAFSFSGDINAERLLTLKQLGVDSFKMRAGVVSCAFRIEHNGDNRYTLLIDSIKRQDKEIKDIVLPLEVVEDDILIKESPFVFLGPATSIQGRFELSGFDYFCFRAFVRTASFTNVIEFFGQERNVIFNGPFNGELRLCWEKGDFSDISALFTALEAGTINIRKEVSFDFLKKYLDEKSQKALVDSFNNYSYNNGKLVITKEGNTIIFNFDFDSQDRGRRNVVIKYHMIKD